MGWRALTQAGAPVPSEVCSEVRARALSPVPEQTSASAEAPPRCLRGLPNAAPPESAVEGRGRSVGGPWTARPWKVQVQGSESASHLGAAGGAVIPQLGAFRVQRDARREV